MKLPKGTATESFEEYLMKAQTHLTSHQLADFRKCPLLYHKKKQGLISEPDASHYSFGRAVHCLVLEGEEEFHKRYEVGAPINPKTGKGYGAGTQKYAEWKAGHGKDTITDSEYAKAIMMQESVKAHPRASELLKQGVPEYTMRAEHWGMLFQSRVDWITSVEEHGLERVKIVDLKTCRDIDSFIDDIDSYGYINQLSFYHMLATLNLDDEKPPIDCYIIAVEKQEPYRTAAYYLRNHIQEKFLNSNMEALGELKEILNDPDGSKWITRYEETISL